MGISHHQKYRYGDLKYQVNVGSISQALNAMAGFTDFLGDTSLPGTLILVFTGISENSEMPLFLGITM